MELELSPTLLLEIGTTTLENWCYLTKSDIGLRYDPASRHLPKRKAQEADWN